MTGYIYWLSPKNKSLRGFKIGYSKTPKARSAAHQCEVGFPLKLIAAIPGTLKDERLIHAVLRHRRCFGEWFASDGSAYFREFMRRLFLEKTLTLVEIWDNPEGYHANLGGGGCVCKCGRPYQKRGRIA